MFICLFNFIRVHIMLFSLLAEKRKELGDAAAKLRNGLDKIDETRAKVLNLRVYWPRRIFK